MKSPSNNQQPLSGAQLSLKHQLILAAMAALSALLLSKPLLASEDPFSEVPKGDPAYSELKQLAQAGWLAGQDVAPADLTRFDVARLIVKAERRSDEIVVAQATSSSGDMLLPPPPEEGSTGTAAKPAEEAGPTAMTPAQKAAARTAAEKSLHNLEEAYQYELKMVKDQLKSIQAEAAQVDSDQYDLRKHLKGITQYPTLAIHGVGRAFGFSQQYSGNDPAYVNDPIVPSGLFTAGARSTLGYLDLNPVGQVSKEVKWNLILRIGSTFEPNDTPAFTLRRITMDFNPPWLSATVGDFDEAYTPFTLWNRNTLDLQWTPEMWARQDDYYKYESFLNHEPYWPFRGLKLGESLMWPDSDLVESLKTSVFADMIQEGFIDNGGYYIGPDQYTSWLIGGMAALKSPKWWSGTMSWQAGLDFYGIILDEPLNSAQPGGYNPNAINSWAHQYLIGSVKPDVRAGLGDDVYVGATGEYAFSSYQDNKMDPNSVTSDFAFMGGPYLKFGNSSISVNYLYVDPYYYSPMAQTRQDAVTQLPETTSEASPWLFEAPLRSQYFLSGVPRASAIFGYYDRTMDNVFPYGMATPNRYGVGLDMDIQALKQNSLKIRGSAYLVSEIQGNLVLDSGGNYDLVDAVTGSTRSFTYVNIGPSINLAPYIGFERDLEVGANFRYEQTDSLLGTLTSTWIIGGVRVDVLPPWEISATFSDRTANGTEEGIGNSLWARYPFLFDATDATAYQPFNINGSVQSLGFTNSFKVNTNSTIFLDYVWTTGNMLPTNPNQGTVNNSFAEVTYEVQF